MNINYTRLFNLNVGHQYFIDGFSRFVHLSPTIETEALLKNGKMLFKKLPNGITVLYRATDDELTPFISLDDDQRFTFVLSSDNIPGLLNISNLDESSLRPYQAQNILYFKNNPVNASSNSNNPEVISHLLLDSIRSGLFTYSFELLGNPTSVLMRVADKDGNLVSVGKFSDGSLFPTTLTLTIDSINIYSQQVDLRTQPKGRYTLTIRDITDSNTLKVEEIYVDDLLTKQKILGLVEIVYEAGTGHLYGETEVYHLQFARAETLWKYYVVNKNGNIDFDADSVLILDNGTINGTPYVINQFPRVFAGIQITANVTGSSGNLIELDYSGSEEFSAIKLSGKTLSGGDIGIAATGSITIINNTIGNYTVSINGIGFVEGIDFNVGLTPAETANNLINAINVHPTVNVSGIRLGYDVLINNIPTLVFRSDVAIPFFEKPKADIQLRKTSDNQTIIPNLPNPDKNGINKIFAGLSESEVYLFI